MDEQANGSTSTNTPPYVSFSTFFTFLNHLRDTVVPDEIGVDALRKVGGTQKPQIVAALKFFGWVTGEKNTPTDLLREFVNADEQKRKELYLERLQWCYPDVFADGINLKTITADKLGKLLGNDLKGDTLRKCYTFFSNSADYVNIEIGPHAKKTRGGVSGPRRKPAAKKKTTNGIPKHEDDTFKSTTESGESWSKLLLSKFPPFDPNWPDDLKKQWFEGFQKFVDMSNGTTDSQK